MSQRLSQNRNNSHPLQPVNASVQRHARDLTAQPSDLTLLIHRKSSKSPEIPHIPPNPSCLVISVWSLIISSKIPAISHISPNFVSEISKSRTNGQDDPFRIGKKNRSVTGSALMP